MRKKISLFLYFPSIFWGVSSSCQLYLATMKTVLSSLEKIWKSYYLFTKDQQETGWTKSYDATVHPWHLWFLDSTISSKILIPLLVEFPWLNHQAALAFRIFSAFRFPCTCWISSKTDLSVVENLKFFYSCSKRESRKEKFLAFVSGGQTQKQRDGSRNWYILKMDFQNAHIFEDRQCHRTSS